MGIMDLFKKKTSGNVAKDRLKLVLVSDRANCSSEMMEMMKNDIIEVISRYMEVGRNGMCVCPFHDDKNPSMKVDRRFHCFGCQADGDVIDFVSRLENVSPKEAALMLAQDFSVPYEDREPDRKSVV